MNCRVLFIVIVLAITGCEKIQKAADVITQPTAREVYERNFKKDDSLLLRWNRAFENAKNDSLQVILPYSESGIFSGQNFPVYSYNVQLKVGERIMVEVDKQFDSSLVFIDLFRIENDSVISLKYLKSAENNSSSLSSEIEKYSYYKIVVQPRMEISFPFALKLYVKPVYSFPISGGGNKNIQSFWADPREGGKRSHEGVDIFAPKGTPVLAVTDGIIGYTGEKGLGGKQVWLRDGIFGKSIYYAHLDSIAVSKGKRVKLGDTLGFVGNTGNAKTTPAHLHFGIYKAAIGPVNPLSYIKKTEIQTVEPPSSITKVLVTKQNAEINKGPSSGFSKLATLKKNDTLFVLGKSEKMFHVVTHEGLMGFIKDTSVKPLTPN